MISKIINKVKQFFRHLSLVQQFKHPHFHLGKFIPINPMKIDGYLKSMIVTSNTARLEKECVGILPLRAKCKIWIDKLYDSFDDVEFVSKVNQNITYALNGIHFDFYQGTSGKAYKCEFVIPVEDVKFYFFNEDELIQQQFNTQRMIWQHVTRLPEQLFDIIKKWKSFQFKCEASVPVEDVYHMGGLYRTILLDMTCDIEFVSVLGK